MPPFAAARNARSKRLHRRARIVIAKKTAKISEITNHLAVMHGIRTSLEKKISDQAMELVLVRESDRFNAMENTQLRKESAAKDVVIAKKNEEIAAKDLEIAKKDEEIADLIRALNTSRTGD
jgi:hypothetical protein